MIDNVAQIEKPKKVNIAIRLLIVSMIISFVSGYMKGMNKPNDHKEIVTDFPIQQLISSLLILSIIISITWFILHNVNTGKNWARIICSFIVSFGAAYFIFYISYYFKKDILDASIRTIQTVFDITAVTFLNSKEVLKWYEFKNIKSSPEL